MLLLPISHMLNKLTPVVIKNNNALYVRQRYNILIVLISIKPLRYLTPREQKRRGPQGLISANLFSPVSRPIEEVIYAENDKNFGKVSR